MITTKQISDYQNFNVYGKNEKSTLANVEAVAFALDRAKKEKEVKQFLNNRV